MGQMLGPAFPTDIGVAVSGGGDSMAMLHLAARWARVYGVRLWAVTVDHGLRADSASEAALVAQECEILGVPHAVLTWGGWDGQGNLQDAARQARLDLIGRWRGAVGHVLFAHTRDDQAETFLLRLKRGSGVEGLAGIPPRRWVPGPAGGFAPLAVPGGPPWPATFPSNYEILRPLLEEAREDLRHYARTLKIPWIEDPSNEDPRFDRVKMRALLDDLEPLGLGRATLAETAGRMARAAEALAHRAWDAAQGVISFKMGDVVIDRDGFAQIERDTQMRLLAGALGYVSSAPYRPRAQALEDLLDRLLGGGGGTLHGCQCAAFGADVWVFREYQAVKSKASPVGPAQCWDHRWVIYGTDIDGFEVRALGPEGLAQAADRPDRAPPHQVLVSQPGIFDGDRLVACRALGFGPAYVAELRPPGGAFPPRPLSH